jgi:hypothetical protein
MLTKSQADKKNAETMLGDMKTEGSRAAQTIDDTVGDVENPAIDDEDNPQRAK